MSFNKFKYSLVIIASFLGAGSDEVSASSYQPTRPFLTEFEAMTDLQRGRWQKNNEWKHNVSGRCRVAEVKVTSLLSEISPPEAMFVVDCLIDSSKHVALYYGERYEDEMHSLSKGEVIEYAGKLKTIKHWGFWNTAYVHIVDENEANGFGEFHRNISQEAAEKILSLIDAAGTRDIDAISKYIDFSISVAQGVPSIDNREEFMLRHEEIFDDYLLSSIAGSRASDWSPVGYRGIMFGNGDLWLSHEGLVYVANYKTRKAMQLHKEAVSRIDKDYYHKLSDHNSIELIWDTDNGIYRVDSMGQDSYRLSWWASSSNTSESPDLLIENRVLTIEGSANIESYSFIGPMDNITVTLGLRDGAWMVSVSDAGGKVVDYDVLEYIY